MRFRGLRSSCWTVLAAGALAWTLCLAPRLWAEDPPPTPQASAAAADPAGDGRPHIVEIEWRADSRLGRSIDLAAVIPIQPGDTLDDTEIRRALSNLYATGLITHAEAYTRPALGGVVLIFSLHAQTWVDSVRFDGALALPKIRLLKAVEQQAGAPLMEDRVLQSVFQLQELYASRGYLDAEVLLDVVPRPPNKRVDVVFKVTKGERARVGQVTFEGQLGELRPEDLRSVLRLAPGTDYRARKVEDNRERLRGWLLRRGYLSARLDPPRTTYDRETQTMDIAFPLEVGPRYEIEVIGADFKKLQKKGFFSYLEEQVYDEALVAQIEERLRTYFQQRGHYHVAIQTEAEQQDDRIGLRIVIDPGPVRQLEILEFEGNLQFTDAELSQLLKTSARQPLKRDSGRLVQETLEEDLANLRSFYLLQGFHQARVGPVRIEELGEALKLIIEIDAGVRQRVVTVEFSGLGSFIPDDLQRRLPLRGGGPFHPALLTDAINIIRGLYEAEGYSSVSITPHLDWNEAETLVDIRFEIREGIQQRVDRVFLRGHHRTRDETVRRFIRLEEGEVLNRGKLLQLEQDLYRLGIFSRVDVELLPAADQPRLRDVLVRLEEGRRWRLAYGFSYHSEDGPGGLLTASRSNIGGRGDRLQLDLRGNAKDARFRLLFDQLAVGRWKLPVTYSIFRQREERESFTVDDLGAQISITRDYRSTRVGLLYDYRLVDLSVDLFDPTVIERQDRELQISSLTPTLLIDRRDDPIDPTRGWNTTLQLEYAFPFLKAEAEFVKLFWQQTHFFNVAPLGVLAASFRLGAIEPLDGQAEPDPLVPDDLPSRLIPASERFFAGGRTTHRAYRRDRLGILGETLVDIEGETVEAGGNGLLLLNLDYRFPISGAFGGTVFADFGNVWADWQDINTDEIQTGVGIGLRYRSPIGPLRLDIGWKLDARPEERNPVFFFSFGNPF